MIERTMGMSIKKEFTIEELEAQYKQTEESQRALLEQIKQKKKEEREAREAAFAKEKAVRKKEVDDAVTKAIELIRLWTDDFGIYSYKSDDDNSIFSSKFWNRIW
jgi:hypothetical protein